MKTFKLLTAVMCIFTHWCYAQNEEKNEFTLLDNISINNIIYGVNSKSTSSQFTLQICDNTNCHTTRAYVTSINPQLLVNDILNLVKTNLDTTLVIASVSQTEKDQITALKTKVQAVETKKSEAQRTEVENQLNSIEEEKDQYSAKIILKKKIPYLISYSDESQKKNEDASKLIDSIGIEKALGVFSKDSLMVLLNQRTVHNTNSNNGEKVKGIDTLKIVDAQIQFFNNKASLIYIKAQYIRGRSKENIIFVNNKFSVPLRYFNNYGSTVSAFTKNRDEIFIDYNDVFDYESDQFFNYSIANSQVKLSNNKDSKNSNSEKVIQRRFFDFFTAIVYSDVMGFNADNSNSLLNAQAKLLLPLNLRNIEFWHLQKFTPFRQIITTANIALNNSFEDESRFINIMDDDNFSNFDLLRKNNLYGKLQLDVITHEAKGWFTNISLGYNAGFYRTGIRYTQTQVDAADIITERQLLSIGHGPSLNFEVRPQTNFGADITFSLEDLNYSGDNVIGNRSLKNDIINQTGKDHFLLDYNLINIEANFYWLTNPEKSKGGVYAKLGSYFHTDSNSIFPQIMVGYATNLTSFVNRFKPKKQVEETE